MAKPHPLVEKTLSIVVALRGFKNVNWNTAKEMVGKASFKIDLQQITPKTIRPNDVLQAQKILTQKTNTMLTPENVQLHSEGAALLLIWAANMIKLYACWKKIGPPVKEIKQPLKYEDMKQITSRTKVMLKNKQGVTESETKEFKKKAIQFKNDGHTAQKAEMKVGNIGQYQTTKKMIFDPEKSSLQPQYVEEKK